MQTYLYASSDFKRTYHTTRHDNGAITCDCPARVECWHIRDVRDNKPIGRSPFPPVSSSESDALYRLAAEGLDDGAMRMALDLFPSMCVEEAQELIDQIIHHREHLEVEEQNG